MPAIFSFVAGGGNAGDDSLRATLFFLTVPFCAHVSPRIGIPRKSVPLRHHHPCRDHNGPKGRRNIRPRISNAGLGKSDARPFLQGRGNSMSVNVRLAIHVLAWTVAIPALNVLLEALNRHRILPLSENIVGAAAIALFAWAGCIYWRCVPHSARLLERSARFATFAFTMLLAAAFAIYVAFWITVAIYGL
jgi:hypothetical protein